MDNANPFADMLRFANGEVLPVQTQLPTPDTVARALANRRKELIMTSLEDGPCTTREISNETGLTVKKLWGRLANLEKRGLVTYDGKRWAVK